MDSGKNNGCFTPFILLALVAAGSFATKGGMPAAAYTMLGFFVGIFLASWTVLIVLLGLPFCIFNVVKGELNFSAIFKCLLTPLSWIIIFAVISFLIPGFRGWVQQNTPLLTGFCIASLGLLSSTLLTNKGRSDFFSELSNGALKSHWVTTDEDSLLLRATNYVKEIIDNGELDLAKLHIKVKAAYPSIDDYASFRAIRIATNVLMGSGPVEAFIDRDDESNSGPLQKRSNKELDILRSRAEEAKANVDLLLLSFQYDRLKEGNLYDEVEATMSPTEAASIVYRFGAALEASPRECSPFARLSELHDSKSAILDAFKVLYINRWVDESERINLSSAVCNLVYFVQDALIDRVLLEDGEGNHFLRSAQYGVLIDQLAGAILDFSRSWADFATPIDARMRTLLSSPQSERPSVTRDASEARVRTSANIINAHVRANWTPQNLLELTESERESFGRWANDARAKGLDTPQKAEANVTAILDGTKLKLTHIEETGIALHIARIKINHDTYVRDIADFIENVGKRRKSRPEKEHLAKLQRKARDAQKTLARLSEALNRSSTRVLSRQEGEAEQNRRTAELKAKLQAKGRRMEAPAGATIITKGAHKPSQPHQPSTAETPEQESLP